MRYRVLHGGVVLATASLRPLAGRRGALAEIEAGPLQPQYFGTGLSAGWCCLGRSGDLAVKLAAVVA